MATIEGQLPTPESAAPTSGRYGEIFDRGYRHYDGVRLGRGHALWALMRYSMKRAMGIKKSWTAKVIPILVYACCGLVALVPVGIQGFIPDLDPEEIMTYPNFFEFIFLLMGIFVATIAPEMLCSDRRERVLPLYFSRAITRFDYLLGKLGATAILTLTVSFVPAFLLWFGRQLLVDSPIRAFGENADDLGKLMLAGALIAFYLGSAGLLVSSFTSRKSVAVAIIIIGYIVLESLVVSLVQTVEADGIRYLAFASPALTTNGLAQELFPPVTDPVHQELNFSAPMYALAMTAFTLLACLVMYLRYVPKD